MRLRTKTQTRKHKKSVIFSSFGDFRNSDSKKNSLGARIFNVKNSKRTPQNHVGRPDLHGQNPAPRRNQHRKLAPNFYFYRCKFTVLIPAGCGAFAMRIQLNDVFFGGSFRKFDIKNPDSETVFSFNFISPGLPIRGK